MLWPIKGSFKLLWLTWRVCTSFRWTIIELCVHWQWRQRAGVIWIAVVDILSLWTQTSWIDARMANVRMRNCHILWYNWWGNNWSWNLDNCWCWNLDLNWIFMFAQDGFIGVAKLCKVAMLQFGPLAPLWLLSVLVAVNYSDPFIIRVDQTDLYIRIPSSCYSGLAWTTRAKRHARIRRNNGLWCG